VANDVRGPSDILISPDNRVFLIDHEGAMREGLQPGDAVTNWLAARVLERMSLEDRVMFLKRVRGRLTALRRVRLSEPPLAAQFVPDGIDIYRGLVQFLVDRLLHLDRLLSELILPEQRYLIEDTKPDAGDGTAPV
jgi:hypothetical protein